MDSKVRTTLRDSLSFTLAVKCKGVHVIGFPQGGEPRAIHGIVKWEEQNLQFPPEGGVIYKTMSPASSASQ